MKVKICPMCKTVNPDTPGRCANASCGYDLFLVEAVEEAAAQPRPEPEPVAAPAAPSTLRSGRFCRKCNQLRPISMFVCDSCGSNLSSAPIISNPNAPMTQPASSASPHAASAWELCAPDGRVLLVINEGTEKLIGWEHELAYYLDESFSFVSRAHAYISISGGVAYIRDNNSQNCVQVNRQNITPGQNYALQSGDQISLGDKFLTNDRRAAHFQIKKQTGGN